MLCRTISVMLALAILCGCGSKNVPPPVAPAVPQAFKRPRTPLPTVASASAAAKLPGEGELLAVARYQNAEQGFSIRFPRGFQVLEWDEPGTVVLARDEQTLANVSIRCPKRPQSPSFQLSDLVKQIQSDPSAIGLEGAKLVDSGDLPDTAGETKWIYLTHQSEGEPLGSAIYLTLTDQRLLLTFATCNNDLMPTLRPAFDACLQSLRFE